MKYSNLAIVSLFEKHQIRAQLQLPEYFYFDLGFFQYTMWPVARRPPNGEMVK